MADRHSGSVMRVWPLSGMASIVMKGATEAIFTREIEGLRPGDDVTFTLTNKGDGPEAADVHIQLR